MATNDNGVSEFSTEHRLWSCFGGAEIATCAEFLACQDPLTKRFICDSSPIADSSIYSYHRKESNIDRIIRLTRDPPQTQTSRANRNNPLDPPQLQIKLSNDYPPQELSYYTSPVATVNNVNWWERNDHEPANPRCVEPATEWWNISTQKAASNTMKGDIGADDLHVELDTKNSDTPILIDLTTYEMDDDIYVGSTTNMLSMSTVTQSLNLTKEEEPDLESVQSQLSERRDDFDSCPVDRLSARSTKGSEPPASRHLRISALEPPGTIHPSQSILIPDGVNSYTTKLAITKPQLPGTSSENTIDLSYISVTDMSIAGTRLSKRRGDFFSIPEEEPIVESCNNAMSTSSTIPTMENLFAPELTSSQINVSAKPELPAPPSIRYLDEHNPTICRKPPQRPQIRQYDDSVSGQAQAGVPYGVSDAATTNSSRISTISMDEDLLDDDDDVDSNGACLDGEHGQPIRAIGSNDSIGSVARNVGIIFVSNEFLVADVTRIA
jgi:hypothetical protein